MYVEPVAHIEQELEGAGVTHEVPREGRLNGWRQPPVPLLRCQSGDSHNAEGNGASTLASPYPAWVKPVLDTIGALMLLVVALPVMVVVAVAIRLRLGPGVIYRQWRVGRHGRPFIIYKFRTMHPDRRRMHIHDGIDRRVCHKRDDDPRHTPLGRFLRKWSLDELPQLYNVLRGDMSLVGPRPELPEVVFRYEAWQHQRHQVKPGITGFWQIGERTSRLAHEGVEFDIAYLQRVSFRTDCGVMLRTLPTFLRRTGR